MCKIKIPKPIKFLLAGGKEAYLTEDHPMRLINDEDYTTLIYRLIKDVRTGWYMQKIILDPKPTTTSPWNNQTYGSVNQKNRADMTYPIHCREWTEVTPTKRKEIAQTSDH